MINGWEFKLIVGRALGWNLLKSSRFTISRSGSAFVFRGSGFGHGLGLCQEGAHVMAQRGLTYRQILTKYFPGTWAAQCDSNGAADLSLRSEHFRVIISTDREHGGSQSAGDPRIDSRSSSYGARELRYVCRSSKSLLTKPPAISSGEPACPRGPPRPRTIASNCNRWRC